MESISPAIGCEKEELMEIAIRSVRRNSEHGRRCRPPRHVAAPASLAAVLAALALSGCTTWQVKGGPQNIDLKIKPSEFVPTMRPLVQKVPMAQNQLSRIENKQTTASILAVLGSVVSFSGTSGFGFDSTVGIVSVGLGLVLGGIALAVRPTAADHAAALLYYNARFPQHPYASPQLRVSPVPPANNRRYRAGRK
jgi:hypothetical protein